MKPDEFIEAGKSLYGDWGWQTRMAEALGIDSSTVRRYVSGATPIPGPVGAAVKCFLREKGTKAG